MMSRNSQGVVAVVFTVIAISFVATTAVLFVEFNQDRWFTIAAFYSHLFIFFPTFGILALCAFFVPASALLDLYWNHPREVKYGKARFTGATLALVAVSMLISSSLMSDTPPPAVWWLKPQTLRADQGYPAGCHVPKCLRLPVMQSVADVRRVSRGRNLSPFVRACDFDQSLMELAPEMLQERICFVTGSKLPAPACCKAQTVFDADLKMLYDQEPAHSVTRTVHAVLLPLKVFFLLMILLIGILLALWRRTIDRLYSAYTGRIERGLLIGALAMLLWPVTNHGFLQSSMLLYGAGEGDYVAISQIMSFVFAAWALLLVLFFFRQYERDIEAAGKIGGGIASAVAILKYNEIIDYATRYIGSGAGMLGISMMTGLLVAAFAALYSGATIAMPTRPSAGPLDPTLPE